MATARLRPALRAQPNEAAARLALRLRRIPTAVVVVAFILLILPAAANQFILVQIFGWAFILGERSA